MFKFGFEYSVEMQVTIIRMIMKKKIITLCHIHTFDDPIEHSSH